MTPDERADAISMAALALAAARADDWLAAGAQVCEIQARHGFTGVQLLMLGLADTLLHAQGGPAAPGDLVALLYVSTCGHVSTADDVRPEVRWVGRFVAARAADDREGCNALVQACRDSEEFSRNVCALLGVAATTLNAIAGVVQR